ncbi:unnamed protein product [Echinostoma caproni]|uniref:Uncharacterized protein n=1 Tax=Echinostoma caproni TaxID=27848 RepID=A0A3P8BB06_9TREM|nr:unnamed protein product [Echinostoma caproni]
MAANVLCCALIVFYEDEPVANADEPCSPTSVNPGSSPTSTTSCRRSMMLRSSMFESARSTLDQSSIEENETTDDTIVPDADDKVSNEPKPYSPAAASGMTSASCALAALPGPFEFFARFHGLRPWRQPQPKEIPTPPGLFKRTRSSANLPRAASFVQLTNPMRIDRTEVDTGQMTPSLWVAHLRRQFAELASPRDHLCYSENQTFRGLNFDPGTRTSPGPMFSSSTEEL